MTGLSCVAFALPQPWSFYSRSRLVNDGNISSVVFDKGGYIWIGTSDEVNGLTVLDPSGNTFCYSVADGLSSNAVNAVAFENISEENYDNTDKGSIWIATDKGITVVDRNGVFVKISSANSPLASGLCENIYIDSENTKWVSVRNRGVYCIDSEFNWHVYTRKDGLSSNVVTSINEDRRGNIWFGSHDNGVSRLDSNGNFTGFNSNNSGLISNDVRDIAVEGSSRIWFLTPQGVSTFDGQNWMSYTSRNSPLGNLNPSVMAVDRFGSKWIGTETGGVFRLDAKGMWQHLHRDNSGLKSNTIENIVIDSRGNISVCTPDGLYVIEGGGRTPLQYIKDEHMSGYTASWKAIEYTEEDVAFSFSLPVSYSGIVSWFYGLFYAGGDLGADDIDYALSGDRAGRMNLTINGRILNADFLISGGTAGYIKETVPDRNRSYPFPSDYPVEVGDFLLPGFGIPSDLPAVNRLAETLITEKSRGDMYRTAKDIVYSGFVQNYTFLSRKRHAEGIKTATDDIFRLLSSGSAGDDRIKARLICSLARASGIPARVVMNLSGGFWSELWISGLGWISVDATYSVYDYIKPVRVSFPKVFAPDEASVVAFSEKDDDLSLFRWNRHISADFKKYSPEATGITGDISLATLVFAKVMSEDMLPDWAEVKLTDNLFFRIVQKQEGVFLQFNDRAGTELESIALDFRGLAATVRAGDGFFWKFRPVMIGDILIIENIAMYIEG